MDRYTHPTSVFRNHATGAIRKDVHTRRKLPCFLFRLAWRRRHGLWWNESDEAIIGGRAVGPAATSVAVTAALIAAHGIITLTCRNIVTLARDWKMPMPSIYLILPAIQLYTDVRRRRCRSFLRRERTPRTDRPGSSWGECQERQLRVQSDRREPVFCTNCASKQPDRDVQPTEIRRRPLLPKQFGLRRQSHPGTSVM